MEHHPHYKTSSKVFLAALFAAFLITTSALWNTAYAETGHQKSSVTTSSGQEIRHFDCDGISVSISRDGAAPLTMIVGTQPGVWVEVPTDEPSEIFFFYNIATSKVAVISAPLISGARTMILRTFADVPAYRKDRSQFNLRCRSATQSVSN